MPSQDEIMKQIYGLVSEGAAMPLTPEMESAFHGRYYDWIIETKKGNDSSPQEIWDGKAGQEIQQKFRDIGAQLAMKNQAKALLGQDACLTACLTIERLSACPHCPDPSI